MNFGNFFAELKRRNVYKVAVAYAVVAWLLIQIATQVFPFFEIPNWAVRLVVLSIAIGFLIALTLAWVFELTPEGIKRTEEVPPDETMTRRTGRKLDFLIIAVLLLVIGLLVYQRLNPKGPTETSTVSEKSIAVLPFDNRSEDKANAYFADGIQDEILTRLSKIAALKVISRTSTQKYKSAPDNLREIGKQLGVANLLEGSVQKVGNRVHVNVQLIRVATDEHLWAETYTRELDDTFSVESEIAGAIAERLNARLSGVEKQELAARPTNNPEAYDAYLRGLALSERSYLLEADATRAMQSFANAVRLDPNFALAWARLSKMHSVIFVYSDASAARRESAHEALQKALQLQPGLLETELAEAYYHYRVEGAYDRAREILEQIHLKWPNNPEAPRALALVTRRQGRWDESLVHFNEALEVDPRNLETLTHTAITYKLMRQFQMALKSIDRALDIAPNDNGTLAVKTGIYQSLGQLDQAAVVLARMHRDANDETALESAVTQLMLRHDYPAGVAVMQSALAKLDPSLRYEHAEYFSLLGDFQRLAGDAVGAKSSYSQCRDEMENLLREQPDNPKLISWLAFAHAGLGDKEPALRLQEQAVEKFHAANDLFDGPVYDVALAQLQALFGEKDRAITALQHLLSTNGAPVTPALLRLEPIWNNLRDDPRFQALLADSEKIGPGK
jgi:TolB-like protein/Tfp pilus assembly protein PilF